MGAVLRQLSGREGEGLRGFQRGWLRHEWSPALRARIVSNCIQLRHSCGALQHCFLIACQHIRVVNRSMVVNLPPPTTCPAKHPGGADRKIEVGAALGHELSPFSANRNENLAIALERVVVEFESIAVCSSEQAFVDAADFRPSPLDASQRVVHGGFVGSIPVLLHQGDVAVVQSAIKLRECGERLSRIRYLLPTGDRFLNCLRRRDSPSMVKMNVSLLWILASPRRNHRVRQHETGLMP